MRTLGRDRRLVGVSRVEGSEPVEDCFGRLTGERREVLSDRFDVMASVGPAEGGYDVRHFGSFADYDRTVVVDDPNLPVDEHSVLWIDAGASPFPTDGGLFDHHASPYATGADRDGGLFGEPDAGASEDAGEFGEPPEPDYDYRVVMVARSRSYTALACRRVGAR